MTHPPAAQSAQRLVFPYCFKEVAVSPRSTGFISECAPPRPGSADRELPLHIGRLDVADMEAAAAVIRRSFADVAARFGLTAQNCPGNGAFLQEEALRRDLARGVAMFGLFTRGNLCGFAAAKPKGGSPARRAALPGSSFPGRASVWYLEKLAVLPECRTGGHGSALLAHALKHMREAGASLVSIGVIADNLPLVAWYERRGFTRAQTRVFATLPFTVQYMERAL